MTPLRAVLLIGAALLALASGCAEKHPPESTRPARPQWTYDTNLSVTGHKSAFEDNREIFVAIKNKTSSPVVIQGLAKDDAVMLLGEGPAKSKIHDISLGVQKPIVVPPNAEKKTSLLFHGGIGTPRKLKIYDQEFVVPDQAP